MTTRFTLRSKGLVSDAISSFAVDSSSNERNRRASGCAARCDFASSSQSPPPNRRTIPHRAVGAIALLRRVPFEVTSRRSYGRENTGSPSCNRRFRDQNGAIKRLRPHGYGASAVRPNRGPFQSEDQALSEVVRRLVQAFARDLAVRQPRRRPPRAGQRLRPAGRDAGAIRGGRQRLRRGLRSSQRARGRMRYHPLRRGRF